MMNELEIDRRSDLRLRLDVLVTLDSESQFFTGLANDISRGGVFVSTYRDIPIGEEVWLEFDLPAGRVLARGAVRWKRLASEGVTPGVGVSFTELSPDARHCIESFCALRQPLYFDEGDRASQC